MTWLAKIIVLAFALWLLAVSIMMLTRPRLMIRALAKMGSTPRINYTELILRFIVGVAVYYWATATGLDTFVKWAGAFLSITALILMAIPRQWHHAYAVWWSKKLSPWMVQISSPLSFVVGLIILKTLLF